MIHKSNYSYDVDGSILFIKDLGGPSMTVTNNIEQVLLEISKELGISFKTKDFKIIYRDTTGTIDGIILENGKFKKFHFLNCTTYSEAKIQLTKIWE